MPASMNSGPETSKPNRTDPELRVYTSRLLARDKTLVLHGGGNTAVKVAEKNPFGEDDKVLYIKGSGWDLETMEAAGFVPVQSQQLPVDGGNERVI